MNKVMPNASEKSDCAFSRLIDLRNAAYEWVLSRPTFAGHRRRVVYLACGCQSSGQIGTTRWS